MLLEKILLAVVESRFTYDKDFFENGGFKSTPAAWSRFKNGEVSINDMKYRKVSNMLSYLFTPLELQVIEKVQFEENSNWLDIDPLKRYKNIKKELLKEWLELSSTAISLQRYSLPNGSQSKNYIMVKKDEYNSVTFGCESTGRIPAGKRNRREWILKNIDLLEI